MSTTVRADGGTRHRVLAGLVYGAMTLAALGVAYARDTSMVRASATSDELAGPLASLALGACLAVGTVLGTRLLVARVRWARVLRADFRALLAGVSPGDALWLAVSSGVGEELLFRGALVPLWGLTLSSLAFGVLHVGPGPRFLVWTAWATLMGTLFGWLYSSTGCLEGCVLAHVAINFFNLRFVLAFDGRLDAAAARPGEQALVRRVRRDGERGTTGSRRS